MDIAPYINSDDRTLVPLRFLAYALGVQENGVKWDDNAQTATITGNGATLVFAVGSNNYTVNGSKKTMDTTPVIDNDRTMLPARYVAEALGYDVLWNDSAQTVTMVPHGEDTVVFAGKTVKKPEEVRIIESVMGVKVEPYGVNIPSWGFAEPNWDTPRWSVIAGGDGSFFRVEMGIHPGYIQLYNLADLEIARFRPIIAVYFPDNVDDIYNKAVEDYWKIKGLHALLNSGVKKVEDYSYATKVSDIDNPPYLDFKTSVNGSGFISFDMRTK